MTRFACFAAIVVALAGMAAGEERIDIFPTRRVNPDYPNALVEMRVEGWSAITFRIAQSGEVEDAFVSDSSGEPALDEAALHAVERWRYESSDFDRCGVHVRISMQLGARVRATSTKRVRRFDEAIARGDIDTARAELDAFRPRALGEVLQRDLLSARLAAKTADAEAEVIALERVPPRAREWRGHAGLVVLQYGSARLQARHRRAGSRRRGRVLSSSARLRGCALHADRAPRGKLSASSAL